VTTARRCIISGVVMCVLYGVVPAAALTAMPHAEAEILATKAESLRSEAKKSLVAVREAGAAATQERLTSRATLGQVKAYIPYLDSRLKSAWHARQQRRGGPP
jgi:hypothetical protein